jgi:uncharacterized protein (TIGR02147 family)
MTTQTEFFLNCLSGELARRCDLNPRYSLRAFAKACEISPGVLSQFLSGKRVPSYKIAQKLIAHLNLSPDEEQKFLNSLAQKHQRRGLLRLSPVFKKSGGPVQSRDLDVELFKIIGDWYHYAILMLTCTENFRSDPKWIASQLSISVIEAKLAVERLLELGFLKSEGKKLICSEPHFTTADKNLTSTALKKHVKQSLEKAIHSVDNDPIEKRSMTYMTMAIDEAKLPEAKALVEEFTNKMSILLESGKKTRVYEFGTYLYPLQKNQETI